jgi:tartrate dehydratase alpha subunit/fumarate hydratase class I-like protein
MAEKSLVNEVAPRVGTADGLGDELVVVDVFFEQAPSTTATAIVSVRTVCGR